jgi:hypothetical protein
VWGRWCHETSYIKLTESFFWWEESAGFAIGLSIPASCSSPGGGREAAIAAGSSRGMGELSPLSMLRTPAAFRSGLPEASFLDTLFEFPFEAGLLELLRVVDEID